MRPRLAFNRALYETYTLLGRSVQSVPSLTYHEVDQGNGCSPTVSRGGCFIEGGKANKTEEMAALGTEGPSLECRMYENEFPEIDEVVMVEVKSVAEMGAYVSLLEYNNMEGMILLSELSRRRIRSINKLIKVGRQEPVMVLRVDEEKGYIDLSKRRVSQEDVKACEDRYAKSKLCHSILTHVATTTRTDLEELYSSIGWPLYRMFGHCFEGFKHVVADPEGTFKQLQEHTGHELPSEIKEDLEKQIKRRMTPQPLKIRADVELTCFAYDGVVHIKNAVREACRAALEADGDVQVKISLVASPLYVLTTHTLKKQRGIDALNRAIETLHKEMERTRGKVVVKEPPRAVSDRDDRLLQDKMEGKEESKENEEDESEEEQDETMGNVDVESGPRMSGE